MSEDNRTPKLPEHASDPTRNLEVYAIRPIGGTLNQLIDYVEYLEGRVSTLEKERERALLEKSEQERTARERAKLQFGLG